MLVGTPLGFNPTSALKRVARGAYDVARDPNVQRAAMAAGQAYAPQQYAQAAMYADRARGLVRAGAPQGPPMPPQMQMMPPQGPPMYDESDGGPQMAPVKKGNMLPLLLIGGAIVVVLFVLKK